MQADIYGRLKSLVIARTLHHYYEDKDALLQEHLQRRLHTTGRDEASYLALLEAGDDAEWAALEAEITIGETFFFRYVEQFAALADTILPRLIAARAATRRLRIWSAGCASGAEPYSVAILLHRLLGAALPSWRISILGTDLNGAVIEAARRAEFGDWALRSLSDQERRRDFLPQAGGRRWLLRPEYRAMVRFERQNLLHLLEGPAPLQFTDYDLVLCRNVLIYFRPDQVRALIGRFAGSLSPDGWLLLGHAEAGSGSFDTVRPVSLPGTVAWQRAEAVAWQRAEAVTWQRAEAATVPAPPVAMPAPLVPAPRPLRLPVPPPSRAAPNADLLIEQVRQAADAGRTPEALAACRAGLRLHPRSAPLCFYAALLSRQAGQDEAAEADFRRTITLCHDFAMAHYHLGLLLTDTGRPDAGRAAIAEAARIAQALPDERVLDGGDGITAARLRALARLDWLSGPRVPGHALPS